MKVAEHIEKAEKALADMVEDGHLKDDFKLANCITAAQYELKEAKNLSVESQQPKANR